MQARAARARQRGFFDFSFPELVITFGVALMVLGPKKLPGLVAQVGRWVGRARHMARQFREQLEHEVNSINEVKPVPRHVAPEVGPAVPPTEATAAAAAYGPAAPGAAATAHQPTPGDLPAEVPAAAPEVEGAGAPPATEAHPEAQLYFAMNGSQPEVVTHNPYTTHEDLAAQPAAAVEPPPEPGHAPAPAADKPLPGDHG